MLIFVCSFLLSSLAPRSAHAGFPKAAKYFKMRYIEVPMDPETKLVNVRVSNNNNNNNITFIRRTVSGMVPFKGAGS